MGISSCRSWVILIVVKRKSIILQKLNRKPESIKTFSDAITLAAGEGFIQIFSNEGVVIKDLLEEVKKTGFGDIEEQVFILRLLETINLQSSQNENHSNNASDQLTSREIEVLSSLASGISYSQAAEKLLISRNTLKTHTKRIYRKLGANGLLQALNKAKKLKILS